MPTTPPALTPRDQLDLLFAIDVRGLAVCRMIVGATAAWHALGWGVAGDLGAWPALAVALALLLGVHARVAALTLWAWLAWQIHARASQDVGVYVTEVLLLWMTLLPTDAALALRPVPAPARALRSVATAAVLLQAAFVYYSAGITKNTDEWLWGATAMADLMHTAKVRPSLAAALAEWPGLLALLSRLTLVIEVLFPMLLFVPRPWLPRLRAALVPFFVALHVGLMLLMQIGTISFVSLAFWALFVPGPVWDRLLPTPAPAGVGRYASRAAEATAGVGLAVVALSAGLSLAVGFGVGPPALERVHYAVPRVGLFQSWYMFNSPAALRAADTRSPDTP